jgi:hypothetical protein
MSHEFEHREYLILPVSELTKVDFNLVLETSAETVRKSIDETKTFVKWEGVEPPFVVTISGAEGPYTYEEILDVLTGVEWRNTGISG